MANLYVYLLPAILHAVYACVPLTPPRPRPTPKPPGATGEVLATTTTTETTTTTVEACSGTPDNSTVTEDGNRCVFPFKDGDILHTSCADHKGRYDWCATSLKSDCSFDTWSKCLETTSKPEEKCLTEEVNSGKECLFPFMFEGKEHLECLPYKGKFWCGLTYEYDKQRWGYCTQALCPPTKVEATEVPVTTQGPTEVPVTSQEPETTTTTTTEVTTPLDWEETQTTVDIAVDGSFYSCNIDFKMTTNQGVKYKDVTSSCSGSSKTDDMIDKLGVHRFTLTMQSGIGLSCEVGAALLPQSLTLSVEVMESTLKCEPLDSQCITIGGNNFPDKCVFPYNYQGRHYKACTDSSKDPSKLWCPTAVTASGEAEKDSWGFCSPSCGYCAGSPIARGQSNSQPCGFDCRLNPALKMAGLGEATMSLNSPIQSTTKQVGGQYTFNIGSQTITISCPETKFHHPALKGENTVIASCGPAQHRFTVTTEDGDTLGTEMKNDFFGCDPCPQSMTYVKGYVLYSDVKSIGSFKNIASVSECHSRCLENSLCNSFEFSKKLQKCELIQDVVKTVFSTETLKDYIICAKSDAKIEENCGKEENLDFEHLIGEQNGPFIFSILDNSKDVTESYRTKVFPVFSSDDYGSLQFVMNENGLPHNGLFSLFLAPPATKCEESSLEKAASSGSEYYPLAIEDSLNKFDDILENFQCRVKELKSHYNGKTPNLCGSVTYMRTEVAGSRILALKQIFNFYFSSAQNYRRFSPNKTNTCETFTDTVMSIKSFKAFETDKSIKFTSKETTVYEDDGFLKIELIRDATEKLAVAFIKAVPGYKSLPAATYSDFVGYEGPVVFLAGSSSAQVYISVKFDNQYEENEHFSVNLLDYTMSRGKLRGNEEEQESHKVLVDEDRPRCSGLTGGCEEPYTHCWELDNDEEGNGVCVGCLHSKKHCEEINKSFPHCSDQTKDCSECTEKNHCGQDHCNNGVCDKCNAQHCKEDQNNDKNYCKTEVGCVECEKQIHCNGKQFCTGLKPVEHKIENKCVECLDNKHCKDKFKSKCDVDGSCVACTVQGDCGHVVGKQQCWTQQNSVSFCAECDSATPCSNGQACLHGKCRDNTNLLPYTPVNFYKLSDTPAYQLRCPNNKDSSQQGNNNLHTLPQSTANNVVAKCALRILEHIITKYRAYPENDNIARSAMAIAVVRETGQLSPNDPELYIAGNMHNSILKRPGDQGATYEKNAIIDDILHILDFEGVKYKKVFVLWPYDRTQDYSDVIHNQKEQSSHRHAEMQIIDHITRHMNNKKKTIESFHINKPPCCACNTVMDKRLNKQKWAAKDGYITELPYEGNVAEAYSGMGNGKQFHIHLPNEPLFSGYWKYPGSRNWGILTVDSVQFVQLWGPQD